MWSNDLSHLLFVQLWEIIGDSKINSQISIITLSCKSVIPQELSKCLWLPVPLLNGLGYQCFEYLFSLLAVVFLCSIFFFSITIGLLIVPTTCFTGWSIASSTHLWFSEASILWDEKSALLVKIDYKIVIK